MRRRRPPLILLGALVLLAACTQDHGREFARYYDDQGLFTVNLPEANDITVTPPQPASQGGAGLLTGVVSSPPAPSPTPAPAFGAGFDPSSAVEPDQTVYQAIAVTTDGFDDLDQMALYFLTGDPVVDVVIDDPTPLAGDPGKLVVADVRNGDQVTTSVAAAMTLGEGGTGYLIAAIFPPGGWDDERADFERVVASFDSHVPPGFDSFPVDVQTP
ncbi:MAG TPA: hypothetical protein VFM81_08210 [Actinomycetota bacterium]|nr:hypothetical protein [Actinomycetota bacterium]